MPLWCSGRSETPSETRDRCERLDARRGDQNERLGFQLDFDGPAGEVYYAGVSRDEIGIMLKEILPDVLPCPNHTRHPWARWDAYIYALDPDTLFDEFRQRGVPFVKELSFIVPPSPLSRAFGTMGACRAKTASR